MTRMRSGLIVSVLLVFGATKAQAQESPPGLTVDKAKRTVSVPCVVAPRKLPNLDQVYPLEVIGTYGAPDGKKAHETVVNVKGIKPSAVHKALEDLGLKPGKPASGEGAVASGPEVRVFLDVVGSDGKSQRLPIEKTMVETKTGKPIPTLKWHFTGSALKQADPEKPEKSYGADLTGTFVTIFPVTDDTVIQANLKFKDQELLKLETNKAVLPKEGAAVTLVIEVK